ncbi:nitroreductase family protein [Hominifimenecus sp. rT4P-3]|uniref:nitroreductase family protein n=1 Tax=Hominifimenecus sp. rT4P-3 TaxID=3242979 RepID=UPI003DA32C2A
MDIFEKRRSIRKYTDQPVTDEILHQLIEAARTAPSGHHTQPWRFIAVRSEEMKKRIVQADHNQEWMMSAPLFLVCVADGYVRLKDETIELNEETPYKEQKLVIRDTAVAIEHIVLKAAELGLGTCWTGYFTQKEMKEILEIPKDKHVVAVLTVGYPAEEPKPKERKAIEEILMYERWGK